MTVMGRFTGKSVVVTGGSQGLGRETAILFATEGAKVVIADVADASATLEAVEAVGGEGMYVKADVTSSQEVQVVIQRTVEVYGKLDILYNNAAILGEAPRLADLPEEDFDRTMAVNVKGVFLCMKYAIRQMLQQGGGVIVNCGSISSLVADANNADYLASKGAVLMLTKGAALEYAQNNIRINAVCPGPMRTPMVEALLKKMNRTTEQMWNLPIGRIADPVEVARVVLFLASDDSSFMVGAHVVVDGGYTII
jgi:NAD(P)-dependent dehydrogenase (short-subunit alcohol dehydrogenase family)